MIPYVTKASRLASSSPRTRARALALDILSGVWRASGAMRRLFVRPRVHMIYLHHVFPDEEQGFRNLLDLLERFEQRIVSYSEAVARIQHGPIDQPLAAFSFDDGLDNCLRAGEMLAERGISACFFINSSVVGEREDDKLAAYCRGRLNMPPVRFLDWQGVERLQSMGHEIGGHTLSHVDMAKAPGDVLEEELQGELETLRKHCGAVRHFAWPYGAFSRITERARDMVYEKGYESIASAVRGCHVTPGGERVCIRREHVIARWPVRHSAYFIARSAGRSSEQDNLWKDMA